jgi:hypothetical protein
MWSLNGFIGIGGYKKGHLVKHKFLLLERCIEGGFNKRILGGIYQYLVKLGAFFNIP